MLFYGLIALVALGGVMTLLAIRTRSRDAKQRLRWVLGLAGLALGILLTVRGMAIAGLPLVGASIGVLVVAIRGGSRRSGKTRQSPVEPARSSMTRKEALETLGLKETATRDEIQSAYRAMMKRVHPDAGGSDALASRVQDAREILLGREP